MFIQSNFVSGEFPAKHQLLLFKNQKFFLFIYLYLFFTEALASESVKPDGVGFQSFVLTLIDFQLDPVNVSNEAGIVVQD